MTNKITEQIEISSFSNDDNEELKLCLDNLKRLGNALQTYKRDKNTYPEWLSDLHPTYLEDSKYLICAADEDKGRKILPYDVDPNLPVSYSYDCDPEYYERWMKKERHIYSDANPIVRCTHHGNIESDCSLLTNLHINLSFSNSIYISEGDWRKFPVEMYGGLEQGISAYEKAINLVPEDPSFFNLYSELIRLYVRANRTEDAEKLMKSFKTVMKPNENIMRFRDYWTLVDLLKVIGWYEEALSLLKRLEKTEKDNPFRNGIFREIAMVYEEQNEDQLAKDYYHKADSRIEMIGKPAPDFSKIDIQGNPISLKDFRGKVVLIDFWGIPCGPCIAEMPNILKVYNTYKKHGFDVIGIIVNSDEEELKKYLSMCNLPWRLINEGNESLLKKLYHVRGIPSPWLIDGKGNVISYQARGATLKKLVEETLRNDN